MKLCFNKWRNRSISNGYSSVNSWGIVTVVSFKNTKIISSISVDGFSIECARYSYAKGLSLSSPSKFSVSISSIEGKLAIAGASPNFVGMQATRSLASLIAARGIANTVSAV